MSPPDLSFRLRFATDGTFVLVAPRPLHLVSNEKVKVVVTVEEQVANSIPPSYSPINIAGWAGKWVGKLDIDDLDAAKKWDVTGAIVSAPAGTMSFDLPKASVNFEVERGYAEFILMPDGSTPQVRARHSFTLTKEALTI